MAPTKKMLKIAIKYKPNFVCIVPEKREEITTEGGLNIKQNKLFIKKIIKILMKNNIRVSLFIEPKINDIKISKSIGAKCIELHTGSFCNLFNKGKMFKKSFLQLENAAKYAKTIGLEVHAGHGLTYKSLNQIKKIKEISEFNIGHYIISESIFFGLSSIIKKFKKLLIIR